MELNDAETWSPVIDFEGLYEVSSLGRIKSICKVIKRVYRGTQSNYVNSEKVLKPWPATNGYLCISLRKNGKTFVFRLHRIVAESFMGRCPKDMEVCHNNGIRNDTSLKNLRFDTRSNNHRDKINHQTDNRGHRHPLSRLSESDVKKIISLKCAKTKTEIAREFNVTVGHISEIHRGKKWGHIQTDLINISGLEK